jgi:hypothetical protein
MADPVKQHISLHLSGVCDNKINVWLVIKSQHTDVDYEWVTTAVIITYSSAAGNSDGTTTDSQRHSVLKLFSIWHF